MKLIRITILLFLFAFCAVGIWQFAPETRPTKQFPEGLTAILAYDDPSDPQYQSITQLTRRIIEEKYADYDIQILPFSVSEPENANLVRRYNISSTGLSLLKKKGANERFIDLVANSRNMIADEKSFSNLLISNLDSLVAKETLKGSSNSDIQVEFSRGNPNGDE